MQKRSFPIEDILYCVGTACKRNAPLNEMEPHELHMFLAGRSELMVEGVIDSVLSGLALLRQYPHLESEVQTLPKFNFFDNTASYEDAGNAHWLEGCKKRNGAELSVRAISEEMRRELRAQAETTTLELVPPRIRQWLEDGGD